jgi:hypothetical protein
MIKNIISQQCGNCTDCNDPPVAYTYKPFAGAVTPKSLATEKCVDRSVYNCSNTRVTKTGQGPTSNNNNNVMILNESFGLTKASNFFHDRVDTEMMEYVGNSDGNSDVKFVNVPNSKCSKSVCATYCDPRVRDARTGDLIKLDRVPYTGHTALENVYNEDLRGYGKNYRSYQDIDAGQIQYYVPAEDKEFNQRPVYTLEADTVQTIRQDPMGGLIPEYKRTPLSRGILNASRYQDTRDQLQYREDIMDGIMWKRNKSNYGVLWENVLSQQLPMTEKNYRV